jgi:4-amino-4-deoxy-L-arabinose transferase-like glycosyltransferase
MSQTSDFAEALHGEPWALFILEMRWILVLNPSFAPTYQDRDCMKQLLILPILLLAAGLRFGNLEAIGRSNPYYTAAVASMLQSASNFFFVAAEPGGSVSVDKPPLGLWIQTTFAAVMGMSGFSTVLPNLIAGLLAVALLWSLVRRWFGDGAGLTAALALAISPVNVAVERSNTADGMLIFTLLIATWQVLKASETGRVRELVLAAVVLGLAFNIKMLQAFLPLPAMMAVALDDGFSSRVAGPTTIVRGLALRLLRLWPAALALGVVSLGWALVVDLTPASARPYVGGSQGNSVIELIVGYNGLQRLLGGVGPGRGDAAGTPPTDAQPPAGFAPPPSFQPPAGGRPGGGGPFALSPAGPLRLFQSGLAAQVSWLLPLGLVLLVTLAVSAFSVRLTPEAQSRQRRRQALWLWGGWLLTCVLFFSTASFFHEYYLAMLAPPLGALIGIGLSDMWRWASVWPTRIALSTMGAAALTLGFQLFALEMYQALNAWAVVPVGGVALGLLSVTVGLMRRPRALPAWALALTGAALFIIPAAWSALTTALADPNTPLVQAYSGPATNHFGRGTGLALPDELGSDTLDESSLAELDALSQDVSYLLVVPSSHQGAGAVLATGRPVLYAGGFSGSDPVLDADRLAAMVAAGEVRYVFWPMRGGPPGLGPTDIEDYLNARCNSLGDALYLCAPPTR